MRELTSPAELSTLDDRLVARFRLLARITAGLIGLAAAAALCGYFFSYAPLTRIGPGLRGMPILVAASMLCLAIAALADSYLRSRLAVITAAVALLVGCTVVVEYAVIGQDTLSATLHAVFFRDPAEPAGYISLTTGIGVMFVALALMLRRPEWRPAGDIFAGLCMIVSGYAVLEYIYGARALTALTPLRSMGPRPGIGLFALSMAVIFVRPEQGWGRVVASSLSGGPVTRRQLTLMLLPPVAGWSLLHAAGEFSIRPAAEMAMLVMLVIVPLSLLILRDGRVLDQLDLERRAKAVIQAQVQDDLKELVAIHRYRRDRSI